jgi:hypothetical protein
MMPDDYEVAPLGLTIPVRTLVSQEQVTVTQGGAHAIANNENKPELTLEHEQTSDEHQSCQTKSNRHLGRSGRVPVHIVTIISL